MSDNEEKVSNLCADAVTINEISDRLFSHERA
jgi:hypothetical protein